MKKSILRFFVSLLSLLGLSSCMTVPLDPYAGGGGGGSYYDGGYYSPTYQQQSYRGSINTGYGWGGGGYNSLCRVCRRSPCCCSHNHGRIVQRDHDDHDHHDHDAHQHRTSNSRSSSSKKSSSNDDSTWRYSGSVRGDDTKPAGNHSREWYKERGYDLSKLKRSN